MQTQRQTAQADNANQNGDQAPIGSSLLRIHIHAADPSHAIFACHGATYVVFRQIATRPHLGDFHHLC